MPDTLPGIHLIYSVVDYLQHLLLIKFTGTPTRGVSAMHINQAKKNPPDLLPINPNGIQINM